MPTAADVDATLVLSRFRLLASAREDGSDDAKPLFLLGPGQRKVSRQPSDGQVSRRSAFRDDPNDARRQIGERTALINQLRAILLERGYVAPQGKRKLEQFLSVLMDEQGGADLSPRIALLVADARAQWAELDRRISAFDTEFVHWVKENEEARRLTTIPGIGAIVASALVAAVGRAESFDRGRDLAARLGLVPRQFTTGGKPKLLGISKRGNKYLRRQLIHGARAALPYVAAL